jgi:malonyl-CoA O-methyltransferase
LQQVLRAGLADPGQGGRLTLGFEIIYGHAFKPPPRFTANAQTHIDLQGMREAVRGTRRASGQ